MRIVITGSNGQLGIALQEALRGYVLTSLSHAELDVASEAAAGAIAALEPDLVIHAAAWTDVDGCAREPDKALRLNGLGAQNVALGCRQAGAGMLYVSTNEVFDGTSGSPYPEFAVPHAINAYGVSKLAGERLVQRELERFYIVRTAWLYARGSPRFPAKILALAGKQPELRVVEDEWGNPTYVPDLATAIARLIESERYGIYHLVNEGVCSRYEWARQILELAKVETPIRPVRMAEFQRPSTPPRFGALANLAAAQSLGLRLRPWQAALEEYFH